MLSNLIFFAICLNNHYGLHLTLAEASKEIVSGVSSCLPLWRIVVESSRILRIEKPDILCCGYNIKECTSVVRLSRMSCWSFLLLASGGA